MAHRVKKQVEQKIYLFKDMCVLLGMSDRSLYCILNRKNWEVIPPPFKLGGKLAWLVKDVDRFLEEKAEAAMKEAGLV
ncbi:helix-turn-helix transcriptional regulator [Pseudodesulfovibrio senegalensis]|uniref:AlpA family phage regulatory protein n=1 Tax=Pseudodesulfovibrio senegalensis TaxID=1721087 RepID=A0A6N6N5U4_9BACT|nr:hypothetical protein [Pseudodesulfovibrio senegalensis]KAB1443552.1 hypothetical protein F8A88_04715 [Pseudodesulfovibrio senegalensis]